MHLRCHALRPVKRPQKSAGCNVQCQQEGTYLMLQPGPWCGETLSIAPEPVSCVHHHQGEDRSLTGLRQQTNYYGSLIYQSPMKCPSGGSGPGPEIPRSLTLWKNLEGQVKGLPLRHPANLGAQVVSLHDPGIHTGRLNTHKSSRRHPAMQSSLPRCFIFVPKPSYTQTNLPKH
jgi:hypothetical protein